VAVSISFFPAYHGLGFLWITPGALAGGLLAALIASLLIGSPSVAATNAFDGARRPDSA
jgi:hypothetical protein